jgi:hypothetical protein
MKTVLIIIALVLTSVSFVNSDSLIVTGDNGNIKINSRFDGEIISITIKPLSAAIIPSPIVPVVPKPTNVKPSGNVPLFPSWIGIDEQPHNVTEYLNWLKGEYPDWYNWLSNNPQDIPNSYIGG